MKPSLTLLVVVLLVLGILAGCAGPNPSKGTASEHGGVAGFWLGLWQGFIAPLVFVVSLFRRDLSIYEVHNNGAWYNFGYLFGLACFFGGSGNRAARRAVKSSYYSKGLKGMAPQLGLEPTTLRLTAALFATAYACLQQHRRRRNSISEPIRRSLR